MLRETSDEYAAWKAVVDAVPVTVTGRERERLMAMVWVWGERVAALRRLQSEDARRRALQHALEGAAKAGKPEKGTRVC